MIDRAAPPTATWSQRLGLLATLALVLALLPRPAAAGGMPRAQFAAKALQIVGDTSTDSFAAGDHLGTTASEADHTPDAGQLRLQAGIEDLFRAPDLGPIWQVTKPLPGHALTITDGVLDVQEHVGPTPDASALETVATFLPGAIAELRTLINPGSAFSSLGFVSSTETVSQWAYFSTRGSGNGQVPIIYTSVRDSSGQMVNVPTTITLGQWHDLRVEWRPDGVAFYADDVLVDTRTGIGFSEPLRVGLIKSEGSDTALLVDRVRVTPYATTTGTFTSRVLDVGQDPTAWNGLDWQGQEPAGTSIAFAVRSGDSSQPDSTWSAWSAVDGGVIACPADRYVQYRADLSSSDPRLSPVVSEVRLACNVLDPNAPQVAAVMPPDSALGIMATTTVAVTFDEALDPATITSGSFTLAAGGSPVPASVHYDAATFTATLVPDAPLAPETEHEARLWPSLTDLDGNALGVTLVWIFTTEPPDLLAPRVVGKIPGPGDVDVPVNLPISVTFSEPMAPATLTVASLGIAPQGAAPVPATVSYDPGTFTATIRPDVPLAVATAYEVRVDRSASDLAGLPMGGDVVWGFTTQTVDPVGAVTTSLADFTAGTHVGTVASESDSSSGGGQLRLQAALTELFTGGDLDPAWHVTRPVEGYLPVISDGILDVQEHEGLDTSTSAIETYRTWGPGVVMESRAMFVPGSRFIDVGLNASTGSNSQYAWFSTAGTGDQPGAERITCRVREYDHTTVAIDTDATYNEWHVFRIEWTPGRVDFFIDGEPVATHTDVLITAPMRPAFYKSDDSDTPFLVDWVRVMPYDTGTGDWTSPVIDAGLAGAAWTDLAWRGSEPAGTSIAFATRTGETATPDSTWSGWQDPIGPMVVSPAGRYAQYRAKLQSADPLLSPVLDEVSLSYDPAAALGHLTVASMAPAAADQDVEPAASVRVVFGRPLDPQTVDDTSFTLAPAGGSPVAADFSSDPATRTATLTPAVRLAYGTEYVTRLTTAITDSTGLPLAADYQWSFTTATAVSAVGPTLPDARTELLPNVPNPFNPATTIAFNLAAAGRVDLRIYAVNGRLVRTLVAGTMGAGTHRLTWTGTDDDGRGLPSGVYLLRLQSRDGAETRKLMLMK